MFGWLKRLFGSKPARRRAVVPLRAKYDAAQTTDDNRRHWANADGLSAAAANSAWVRATLRNRARYERDNDSYVDGIVSTLAQDLIGTGPRLQMQTDDPELNAAIERAFHAWANAIGLAAKLRCMKEAKIVDGEAFAVFVTNPRIGDAVKLDLRPVEADRVSDPSLQGGGLAANQSDGIEYDDVGNPVSYTILRNHPGDGFGSAAIEWDRVPAKSVLHWFNARRPGQIRGIPEITSGLALPGQLRRFTQAVLSAAEAAADMAVTFETQQPADGEADAEPMDTIELEKGMGTFLPDGYKANQLKPEQPGTTFDSFEARIINRFGRGVNLPFNKASGNSSTYNYSSGRLDHQGHFKSLRVERADANKPVLMPIFFTWLAEALLIPEYLPSTVAVADLTRHQWMWDGFEHVDPVKEANADATNLASLTTTLGEIYAEKGQDWEAALRQRAKEEALKRELGLQSAPPPSQQQQDRQDQQDQRDLAEEQQ